MSSMSLLIIHTPCGESSLCRSTMSWHSSMLTLCDMCITGTGSPMPMPTSKREKPRRDSVYPG